MTTPLKVTPGEAKRLERNLKDKKMDKIIKSKKGTQNVLVKQTSIGVIISVSAKSGLRSSVHIFDECIGDLIEALRAAEKTGAKTT
jgi:hypothetical protein